MKTIFSGQAYKTSRPNKNAIKFGLEKDDFLLADSDYIKAGKDYTVVILPGFIDDKQANLLATSLEQIQQTGFKRFLDKGGKSLLMTIGMMILAYIVDKKV